ncbi:cytochrome c oxidase biogenesis protein [Candidatus Photodesmus katoptron]|uniref:Heavy metal translocating P-type ATPase n=2 Tax=Candidatus Photodesmus anomalopis TaxID=28176 RepID=S3DIN7_9GAMM|nr:heavy metal translocating P-type ATPase [Candidatus Photodesmus katoptron Akat1]KEY90693.1 cytochrome c oxidase biogenesis protein [Candidatus Photodesmus katoptron]
MCCPGCEAVAITICDSGLLSYYKYRTEPAKTVNVIADQLQNLVHYDNEDIQSEFVHKIENLSEIMLSLEGISCAACAWLIEKKLSHQKGVVSIRVNITTSRALLTWNQTTIKLSSLLLSIHQLGYKAAPFEIDSLENSYNQSMKKYLYRLGIAGLASMQIMMLAIVLYFEVFSDLDKEFKHYFRWISLIFATPVILYSALPFYLNAYRNIKSGIFGVDLPVSIALIFSYIASFIATVDNKGEVFFESISMFTFFLLIGRFLEIQARRKASIESSNRLKLVPALANTITGKQIAANTLQLGDRIRIFSGEYIPVDGKIISEYAYIDESILTGETIPIAKQCGDIAYAGTLNLDTEKSFDLEVVSTKNNSMVSNIARLQDKVQMSKPKIAKIADILARYFVIIILLIAACTWLFWHKLKSDDAFWIMLSVLVSTCPCAFSLATPAALTCATFRMGKLNILLRKGHVFETLCKVKHLIVDKTGTLTHGYIKICNVTLHSTLTKENVLGIAGALEAYNNHPIARAFKQYKNDSFKINNVKNFIGSGVQGYYQGKLAKIGNEAFVFGSSGEKIEQDSIYLSLNGEHVATFIYRDPIRSESKKFIECFKNLGVKITLLTGDSSINANNVAKFIGIDNVISNLKPKDKLSYLQKFNKNDITMVIGDGINDAPILAGSHISIAMGGGSNLAKTSADMVLLEDQLNRILQARELALKTRRIIFENLAWSLGYNFFILPLAVSGLVVPYLAVIGMSSSSIIVLSNSLRLLKEKVT